MKIIPYPLSAACIEVAFHPFCWGINIHIREGLTDFAKEQGVDFWFIRIGCFTVSYRRMI